MVSLPFFLSLAQSEKKVAAPVVSEKTETTRQDKKKEGKSRLHQQNRERDSQQKTKSKQIVVDLHGGKTETIWIIVAALEPCYSASLAPQKHEGSGQKNETHLCQNLFVIILVHLLQY